MSSTKNNALVPYGFERISNLGQRWVLKALSFTNSFLQDGLQARRLVCEAASTNLAGFIRILMFNPYEFDSSPGFCVSFSQVTFSMNSKRRLFAIFYL